MDKEMKKLMEEREKLCKIVAKDLCDLRWKRKD